MRFSRNNIMGSRGLFFSLSLWVCTVSINQAADTITRGQSIRDGQTLVSAGERFELGFFSPVNSTKRYVGIWYFHHKVPIQTVVWVANRENPISDSSGVVFTVGDDWNLVILDSKKSSLIWSSNVSEHTSNSTALLSDSGNLILRDGVSGDNLWESFHHPTDSFLPGMKLGLEGLTGRQIVHTSWKSPADPAVGDFSVNVVSRGAAQIVVLNRGRRHWRSGQWDGETFAGVANKRPIYLFGLRLTYDDQNGNKLFSFALFNNSDFVMYRIRWDGQEQHLSWDGHKNEWVVPRSQPMDACEEYGKCGEFGICRTSGTVDSAACTCLKGFEPRSGEEGRKGNWADGCSRRTPLSCGSNSSSTTPGGSTHRDGFFRVEGVKLPDYEDWVVVSDEGDCEQNCLGNCSCIAYAYVGGIGCLQWGTNLVDIRHFQEGGNRLFLRLAASELGDHNGMTTIIIVTTVLAALVLTSACSIILCRCRRNLKGWGKFRKGAKIFIDLQKELELGRNKARKPHMPLFDYQSLVLATNHFSDANKLGQGGFGPVYKGCGAGGQEVAIKRLSSGSGQGVEEFMNEVILFSNLQHRNLVRLLGCCIHGEEQMLVYEFMPNKSLDLFLFDSRKRETLDWTKRFNIIKGIARGLLYLHRDSSLRIIHRDLKAGNILLDEEMKPKIADFGIARIFGGNQYQATTRRVMGTYGYMSPEYALEGSFSSKSDVYSFGVLVLEIVTGKKNSAFYVEDQALHLTGYAWKLWNEDISVAALLDATIRDSCNKREVMRCVHLGLLCVQDLPSDRPEICYIASMLDSEASIDLMPKQPKFVTARSMEITPERSSFYSFSTNDLTFTLPLGR